MPKLFFHSLDPIATHVLIRVTSAESSIPVGTARISYTPDEFGHYRIGRLAVMKEYRKYRLGSKIMLALEEWAIRDAPTRLNGSDELRIALHSQMPAQPFYAK
jgi:predicted GNAT family N-acyltransferase